MIKMKYSDVKYFDVINGLGVRVSIFVSGCSHRCEHCFNKNTWDDSYGKEFDESKQREIINYIKKYDNVISGISILGGDPTYHKNIAPLCEFIDMFKKEFPNKDIWIWSGYTWERIVKDKDMYELISRCDILVDGKFVERLKNIKLKFRGSSNQRIIDVKKSIINNKVEIFMN